MNVVDSSGWLEFFADGPHADFFAKPILDARQLIVPAISIFEVFKRVLQQRSEGEALNAVALMKQGQVVPLDDMLAIFSASLSHQLKLPMADSIILATARSYNATLWTQDTDFIGIDGGQEVDKRKK